MNKLARISGVGACALSAALILAACGSTPAKHTTTTSASTTSTTSTTVAQSTSLITPTASDEASVLAAFRQYKIAQHTLLASEKLALCTGQGCSSPSVFMAYDAAQQRTYALAYTMLVGHVSYNTGVAAQDGGLTALLWRHGNSPWVVWTWNLPTTCASEFPAVISALWHLHQYGDCRTTYAIPNQ
jgi:hypothetical protein